MESKDELPEVQPEAQETSKEQTVAAESTWAYTEPEAASQPAPASLTAVHWSASEFVHHDKAASWFLTLGVATVVAAGLSYLLTQDKMTAGVVVIGAILFGIMANRKPQTLEYSIDSKGITIGPKRYSFASFKSFSVIIDGAMAFIQLMPVSRIAPPTSVYYPPDQENEIVETLGSYLPHEERKRDSVDRLMSRIRF